MIICSRSTFCNALLVSTAFLNPTSRTKDNTVATSLYAPTGRHVRQQVKQLIQNQDPTLAGSILRLAFHDAVVRSSSSDPNVGGADGSIRYELNWPENRGLNKPLKVVQEIYESQKNLCGSSLSDFDQCQELSFADVLALSGAAAVEAAQGPRIPIKLGRKDAETADQRYLDRPLKSESERSTITTSLPSAGLDSLGLRNFFVKRLGLSESEMVAFMGAHDLGRHVILTGMPKECLRNLTRSCLEDAPVLAPFVTADPDTLSNRYFQTLLRWNDRNIKYGEAAFIPTDVALVVDEGLKKHVVAFAKDEGLFFQSFARAYQKLVETTATSSIRY